MRIATKSYAGKNGMSVLFSERKTTDYGKEKRGIQKERKTLVFLSFCFTVQEMVFL